MMSELLAFTRGPLLRICLAIMVLGLGRHLLLTSWEIIRNRFQAGDGEIPWGKVFRKTAGWILPVRRLKTNTALSIFSITFHLCFLIIPFFLAGHVALINKSIGFSWPVLPALLADILTILGIVAGMALLISRRIDRTRRLLSRTGDYWILICLVVTFLFGFMTMHPWCNPFSHDGALLLHLLSAQLVMVLAPFTKLSHIVLMPLGYLAGVIGWRFPPTAGTAVGRDLDREDKPI